MGLPLRFLLPLAMLSVAPAVTPAAAQGAKPSPPAETQRPVAGLPLYTADGKAIGRALAMGVDEDEEEVLVAEIERLAGIGPRAVAIPTKMFVRKADRIELTLTEAEVAAKLGR